MKIKEKDILKVLIIGLECNLFDLFILWLLVISIL